MFRVASSFLLLLFAFCILPGFVAEKGAGIKIPKKVNAIIQDKCYGCHAADSKNQRAKDNLNWDELNSLSVEEQIKKIKGIEDVLQEGSMPPGRFLEKNPGKKLTEKETAAMQKWASKTRKQLER